MITKFLKIIFYSLLAISLVVLLSVSLIFFKPNLLVALANKYTDYNIETADIKLQLSPLRLRTTDLKVSQNNQILVEIENAEFAVDWLGSLKGRHTIWYGDFANGYIDYSKAVPAEVNNEKSAEVKSESIAEKIHLGLTAMQGNIENVNIIFDDSSSLSVESLSTDLMGNDMNSYQTLEQKIELILKLNKDDQPLVINGELTSSSLEGSTYLVLDLNEVDLTSYLNDDVETNENNDVEESLEEVAEIDVDVEPTFDEAQVLNEMDWSWLDVVDDLHVLIKSENIILGDNSIKNAGIQVQFNDGVIIENLAAEVDWAINEELQFNDEFSVSGQILPLDKKTQGPDLQVDLNVDSLKLKLDLEGQLNVNGFEEQSIGLNLSLSELPITEEGKPLMDGLLEQYLPVSLDSQIITDVDKIELVIDQSNFGDSVFSASLMAEEFNSELPSYKVALLADKITYQALDVEVSEEVKEADEAKSDKLFTEAPIDWSWLKLADADLNVKIKELRFNQYLMNDFVLPLRLGSDQKNAETRIMSVEDFSAELAGGDVSANIELTKGSDPAQLNLDLDVKKLSLEDLGVLPEEQIMGGEITVDTQLKLNGDSLDVLASSSNGLLYVELTDAVVQNDTFEVIGSDLVLELLTKLNPFAKKNKTTNLECAIVFAPIENGQVDIKDSLALKTSKIIIVGSGDIDLEEEKLNMKFTPTSRGGVGVNVGSLVKFVKIGGRLSSPKPVVDAGGAVASALAAGAAVSTGGASLVATSLIDKAVKTKVCEKARTSYEGFVSN